MNEIKLQSNKKKKNEKLHKHRDERDWTKTSLDNLVVVLFPYDFLSLSCILTCLHYPMVSTNMKLSWASVVNILRTEKYSNAFCWSFSLDWKLEAVRLICKLVPLKWVSSNPSPISYFCNKMGFTVFPDYWWRWILQVFINLDAKEGSILWFCLNAVVWSKIRIRRPLAGEHAEVSVVSVTFFRDYKVSWTWMLTAFAIA